mmetsp:Transcript_9970/g.28770  ORF Transcript_9970/g.28770 Transcript_9970/m.28770 type:complete len:125 (+) Transcript_9970:43-417(+)
MTARHKGHQSHVTPHHYQSVSWKKDTASVIVVYTWHARTNDRTNAAPPHKYTTTHSRKKEYPPEHNLYLCANAASRQLQPRHGHVCRAICRDLTDFKPQLTTALAPPIRPHHSSQLPSDINTDR